MTTRRTDDETAAAQLVDAVWGGCGHDASHCHHRRTGSDSPDAEPLRDRWCPAHAGLRRRSCLTEGGPHTSPAGDRFGRGTGGGARVRGRAQPAADPDAWRGAMMLPPRVAADLQALAAGDEKGLTARYIMLRTPDTQVAPMQA